MSKKVLGVGLAVVGMALMFTGIGAPLGTIALGAGLGSIGVASVIGMGLLVASSMLLGPSVPKMPGSLQDGGRDRLHSTLDPIAPRKIAFGHTALANDVRYQAFTGEDQEYLEQIVCVASHEVHSIDEIWLDNELAWTSAGGVQGRYVDYLTVQTRLVGTSSNGIAIDAIWTSTATLTGCAYVHLKFKLISDNAEETGNESPFASGVTSRTTFRGKGAKVYDPRLDSTVAGGSGTQRADNQATWAWNDNASRNPALQELFYELGWRINGKLAVGKGVPKARLDLASYATGANVCDESITKSAANGGGTEPRYRSDGVLSEGDDPAAVREALCATMNAVLRDAGGKLSLTVLKNDLATPIASFDENDCLAGIDWVQTPDLQSIFNITRGQRIDSSNEALYQPVDYPEASLTSVDGIDRIDTFNLPLVQSNGQAQRLAKQRLQRNQYQGRLTLKGKPSWWQLSLGNVFQFSHPIGWTNKLFRCAGIKISRSGQTEIVAVEENAAIYAWDNSESAPVQPPVPTKYDPRNHPFNVVDDETQYPAGNMLTDTLFRRWTKTAGVVRKRANALDGYAKGNEKWFLELSPSTTVERSGLSPKVPVTGGQRYFFRAFGQRGTTLGSGSRLNFGGQWIASDGVTVVATASEGAQQSPTSLSAGALPKEVAWSQTAPSNAAYFRMKIYTPALSSSSGTFRVEAPWVALAEPSADVTSWIDGPPQSTVFKYSHDGVAEAGEFPRDLTFTLNKLSGQVTSGVSWRYRVKTGTVNGFTASSGWKSMSGTGTGTLTVSSLGTDTASVEIEATVGASVATKITSLSRQYAPSPTGSGGGGDTTLVSKTSGFALFSGSTFVDITGWLTGTMPSGDTDVNVNVNLECSPSGSSTGSWTVEMKVQRDVGGTPTDIGTVRSAQSEYDSQIGVILKATFNFSQADTGLTGGATYNWRIMARVSAGGTRQHSTTGTVSVVA